MDRSTELRRIACVDDEEDILAITRIALESIGGFEVTVYHSARDALGALPAWRPDLIILDVMMPDMNGPQTLEELRRIPELARTPIVFMTARIQGPEIEHYRALGAAGVISKPFDPMALSDEIRRIWSMSHEPR